MNNYICVDIGGTEIKHSVLRDDLYFLSEGSRPSDAHLGADSLLGSVVEIVGQYKENHHDIAGICISTAGMVDARLGEIYHAGTQIPHYKGTKIKATMEDAFGIPCEVENDVNCAGLAEATFGAGKGKFSCLCLTIGTGVGSCYVEEGRLLRGFSNGAGEIGYMNMDGSQFEKLAATSALVNRTSELLGRPVDGREIFDLAEQGDPLCNQEIDRLCKYLARGISHGIYMLNPETVILGGGIMSRGEFLRAKLEKELEKALIPFFFQRLDLRFANYGNKAGMIGAYTNFIKKRGGSADAQR